MKNSRFFRFGLPAIAICGLVACGDEVTGSRGALARIDVDAPSSARSGQTFEIRIQAVNVGISNIRRAHVDVTLPAPLTVLSVNPDAGTTASVSGTLSGARISWELNTLDSNSDSELRIQAVGVLPPGAATRRLTIEGSLTGERIDPGDAVARDDMDLTP